LGTRLAALGARTGDDVLMVEAGYVLGIATFWRGLFPAAREHFRTAVSRYRPATRSTHLISYGLDPRAVCMSRLANTLWFLGRHGAAIRARDAALGWAGESRHPPSLATALVFAALLSLELRDPDGVRRYTRELQSLGAAQYARATLITTEALAGYVEVLDGRPAPGLARVRRIVAELPPVDPAPGLRASTVRILLACCTAANDARAGLAAADDALAATDGVATWVAEAHRLRAEFRAVLDGPTRQVATDLDRARTLARRQGAALFTLRVATTRARLGIGTATAQRDLTAAMADLRDAHATADWADAVAVLGDGAGARPAPEPVTEPVTEQVAERVAERSWNAGSGG
jgi:hypothetical protein